MHGVLLHGGWWRSSAVWCGSSGACGWSEEQARESRLRRVVGRALNRASILRPPAEGASDSSAHRPGDHSHHCSFEPPHEAEAALSGIVGNQNLEQDESKDDRHDRAHPLRIVRLLRDRRLRRGGGEFRRFGGRTRLATGDVASAGRAAPIPHRHHPCLAVGADHEHREPIVAIRQARGTPAAEWIESRLRAGNPHRCLPACGRGLRSARSGWMDHRPGSSAGPPGGRPAPCRCRGARRAEVTGVRSWVGTVGEA